MADDPSVYWPYYQFDYQIIAFGCGGDTEYWGIDNSVKVSTQYDAWLRLDFPSHYTSSSTAEELTYLSNLDYAFVGSLGGTYVYNLKIDDSQNATLQFTILDT